MTLRTANGKISLGLPRSFTGLFIYESGCNRVNFASNLEEQMTMISDSEFFIGDVTPYVNEGVLDERRGGFDVARVGTSSVRVAWASE